MKTLTKEQYLARMNEQLQAARASGNEETITLLEAAINEKLAKWDNASVQQTLQFPGEHHQQVNPAKIKKSQQQDESPTPPVNPQMGSAPPAASESPTNEINSFILYNDNLEYVQALSREERGDLLLALFEYVNGLDVLWLTGGAKLAFAVMKRGIGRNRDKWEKTQLARSKNGKLGGAPKGNQDARKQPKTS